MVKAVSIAEALKTVRKLEGRTPQTPEEEFKDVFATLSVTRDGGVYAGSFSGESMWERHGNGDELVQILDGETELTVLTGEGETVMTLSAGMLTVVPQGCWHRFRAPKGVTVMTMTPSPTDHMENDPRQQDK